MECRNDKSVGVSASNGAKTQTRDDPVLDSPCARSGALRSEHAFGLFIDRIFEQYSNPI